MMFIAMIRADRHKIHQLANPVIVVETRDEDIGFRPVELFEHHFGFVERRNPVAPADPVVQDRAEQSRRVKMRKTEPVDRSVHRHQCNCVQIADDAVVLDGLV